MSCGANAVTCFFDSAGAPVVAPRARASATDAVRRSAIIFRSTSQLSVRHGSLGWTTPQEVLGSGEVIVPRAGVDLPLAQFRKGLTLDSLRVAVHAVDG